MKTKGARKINFQQFVDALSLIAAKKGISLGEAADTVVAANGPCVSGTKADYVKFHDDKAGSAMLMPKFELHRTMNLLRQVKPETI